jgi:putative endonuclease
MPDAYYVYILASQRNGTRYIGVTNDLTHRIWEHREGMVEGFTKDYGVKRLLHFEVFDNIHDAIHREKRLKKWKRQWKIDLIQSRNLLWDDLYENFNG